MTIIDHAEKYLGEIDHGWKDDDSEGGLQIVSFRDCPGESASTFMSLGLSDHTLDISETKKVRQELLFSVYSSVLPALIVSFLLSLCESILSRHKAVLRGEVIPLSNDMVNKIGFDAVYCSIPVFFEDDFSVYDESSPSTVMVWMLPIYKSEVDYITTRGWESFEELLEEKDPDLCALDRAPVI
jgi:hypothetical protein